MAILKRRVRPEPWSRHRERAKHRWLVPFIAIEWVWAWLAYWLSGWAFLEVLEYFGTLSVLLAVVSYFSESKDRIKQKHYQAWQVINSAQGKGGSGGRIDALNCTRTACRWWVLMSAAHSSKTLISAEQTCSERTFAPPTCEVGILTARRCSM